MKKENIFWLLLIVLVIILTINSIIIRNKESKKIPFEQNISEALITVKAPPFERNIKNEEAAKDELGENIKNILFFQSSYKNIDYTLIYAQYAKEVNLSSGIQSVIKLFKDNNFVYEVTEKEINERSGIYIEGTFEKDDKVFGIKEQLIKNKSDFWQILVIFPYNEQNEEAAKEYIESIKLIDIKE